MWLEDVIASSSSKGPVFPTSIYLIWHIETVNEPGRKDLLEEMSLPVLYRVGTVHLPHLAGQGQLLKNAALTPRVGFHPKPYLKIKHKLCCIPPT